MAGQKTLMPIPAAEVAEGQHRTKHNQQRREEISERPVEFQNAKQDHLQAGRKGWIAPVAGRCNAGLKS